jgi:DNA repair exonuclease SbcCD nuclease subunit
MNAHKMCEHGTKPVDLLKKSSLIFSGHFHLNEERVYDNGTIVYVGSPFQLDFGERECKKGYYVLDFNDLGFEFIENKISPVHRKVLLSELVSNKEMYLNSISNNFIKLVIDQKYDQNIIDEIVSQCNSKAPLSLLVDPLVNYDLSPNSEEEQDLSGVDITKAIVEFVNMLDIDNKEEVIKHTINLYNQSK